MADEWLSITEASRLANYHPDHLRVLVRDGKIKAKKVVSVWLVNKKSLLSYIRNVGDLGSKRGRKKTS